MIINPTKKASVLFNQLPQVEDAVSAREFAKANPFFSWHANYFNVNRKKMVLVTNDLTYVSFILVDVNAQTKKQLADLIPEGIRTIFAALGIEKDQIEQYLAMAGALEVNAGFNRVVTGVMNNMLEWLQFDDSPVYVGPIDLQKSLELCQGVYKRSFPTENLQKAFIESLVLHEVTTIPDFQVQKTWRAFSEFPLTDDWLDEAAWEVIAQNNQLVLDEFRRYLLEKEGLSKKTVDKHVGHIKFYMNQYLPFYGFESAFVTFAAIDDFFSWGARKMVFESDYGIKKMGTSFKKFYQFLVLAGEIEERDLPKIREEIELGMESAMMTLELFNDFY